MKIDRSKVQQAFSDYVEAYDSCNQRIALKIEHSKRVADLCERIAKSNGLKQDDLDLAWTIGLLHDMGRFEQLRRWGTFLDAHSTNHAKLGAEVLFSQPTGMSPFEVAPESPCGQVARRNPGIALFAGLAPGKVRMRDFVEGSKEDQLIRAAIATHSDYRLPDDLPDRTRRFCNIVRDADKLDILHTISLSDADTILGVSLDALRQSRLSSSVLEAFAERRCVKRNDRVFPADYVVGFLCFAFELTYAESRKILVEQGEIFEIAKKPLGLEEGFSNERTKAEFERMENELRVWLKRNC